MMVQMCLYTELYATRIRILYLKTRDSVPFLIVVLFSQALVRKGLRY